MTEHASFKLRIRERMARTGERYAAARRVMLEQAARRTGRIWHAEPEVDDDGVYKATGRRWNDWCDLIDARPTGVQGHTATALWHHGCAFAAPDG